MKAATAGRTYQVPRSTLHHKISGLAPEISGHVGPQAVLNLETPFINNRPGRSWFLSFMARHPDLIKKHAEYINKARAMITEERIRK